MPAVCTLDDLRRFAVARTLFPQTSLRRVIERLGFIQADPIRSPARAQDLTLRHRVKGYRVGDLERGYAHLPIEEDFFINYGFMPRRYQMLMHPRTVRNDWSSTTRRLAQRILQFARERGPVRPRDVEAHFAQGKVANYWGGKSNATTHLLDEMHYRGLLRVTRREGGTRIYAAHDPIPSVSDAALLRSNLDSLIDIIVRKYAPLPSSTLRVLVRRLRHGVPHMSDEIPEALRRAMRRFAHHRVAGVDWYWPPEEDPLTFTSSNDDQVRLLAPFDPLVWDRVRFELLWGWPYRFEAYTPRGKRIFGYYAMPILWGNQAIGWANISTTDTALRVETGFAARAPRDRRFRRELDADVSRLRDFLFG